MKNQKGFGGLFIVLAMVVIAIIGGLVFKNNKNTSNIQPTILWKYQLPKFTGTLYGSQDIPYIKTKYVVIQTEQKKIVTLDRKTGEVKWSFTIPEDMIFAISSVLEDKVIISTSVLTNKSSGVPSLYALDLETGNANWKLPLNVRRSFQNSNDTLFLLDDTHIYAINTSTGNERWKIPFTSLSGALSFLQGFYKDNTLYFGINDPQNTKYYFAIDATNGQEKWRTKLDGFLGLNPPIIEEGKIYINYSDCKTEYDYCIGEFDINSGNKLWETNGSAVNFIVDNNVLYKEENNLGANSTVKAVNLANKEELWTYKASHVNKMLLDQGVLYIGENGSNLTALNTTDGKKLWSIEGDGPIYKYGDAIFIGDFRSIGFPDSFATFLQKIDTNTKRRAWEFPDKVLSQVKGMEETVYFIGFNDNSTYLYAVK